MFQFRKLAALPAAALLATMAATSADAGTLVINANTSDPDPKAAFEKIVADFQAANPDVTVEFNVFDHESYKTVVRNWLTSEAPDVIYWFAGERMKTFVDRDLLEDVSDIWEENDLDEAMASSMSALTVDGAQYGIPYSYYQWGVYYRTDLFEENGVAVPETFDELVAACETLSGAGIAPVAIGTKFLWTAAGWFDYLNLRTNGLDFHLELAAGEVAYTDERVQNTFDHWARLIEAGCFIDDHAAYSWQEAQPFLYQQDPAQQQAAMYLIGNFITPQFPAEVEANMGFFQFPVIDPNVAIYEDAPIDTLHIPARAANKDDARRFLAFVAQAEVQRELNIAINQLPPHSGAGVGDNRFLQAGYNMLNEASGIAQFYDRDTNPEMARAGMEGFQEFMINPDRRDRILERLDRTRQRIYRR